MGIGIRIVIVIALIIFFTLVVWGIQTLSTRAEARKAARRAAKEVRESAAAEVVSQGKQTAAE